MPDAGKYDIKILATDIDLNMLAEGQKGTYTEAAMSDVPANLRSQWFVPVADGGKRSEATAIFGVAASLRELVIFRELNLFGNWPMKGCFQAVFCRNVAIYFEEDAQMEFWSRFVPKLAPDGVLYIGHSERIAGAAANLFEAEAITTYRLRREGRA
jgi:chemotaxis protein methyltransferase CheR